MTNQLTIPRRRVRLVDIANQAGVSQVTVSKVLSRSDRNNTHVAKATAQRIQSIARQMGYTPNLSAKQLAGGKSRLIGVIVDSFAPDIDYKVLAHLEREAARRDYRLIVGQLHDDVDSIRAYFQDFVGRNVEGVVCLAHDYPAAGEVLEELFRPLKNIVFVGRPQVSSANWVGADIAAGAEMLVHHLADAGRRRIALFLTSDQAVSCKSRIEGFIRGLETSGLERSECPVWIMKENPLDPIDSRRTGPLIHEALGELIETYSLDGMIATNDLVAMYLIQSLVGRGRRVPEEIAITGFDNSPMAAAAVPPITSIDQCPEEVAQKVMEVLMSQANAPAARPILVPPRLVARQSSGRNAWRYPHE